VKLVPASLVWIVPELPALRFTVMVGSWNAAPPAIGPGKLSVATPLARVIFGAVEPSPEPPVQRRADVVEFAGIGIFSAKVLMFLTVKPLTEAGMVFTAGLMTTASVPPGATVAGAVTSAGWVKVAACGPTNRRVRLAGERGL